METSTLDATQKPLEELVGELPPGRRAMVREYVQHLLTQPAQGEKAAQETELGPDAEVTLREITEETVRVICSLSDTLTPPRDFMVAPNAVSIAQAYFQPKAWFRAIYASETPVGFVMLYDDADKPEYFLWRLMVAEPHHRKGFGRRAIELLVEYVKTRPGAIVLEASCLPGPGSPEGFYRAIGFQRNGKMIGQEVGLSLAL